MGNKDPTKLNFVRTAVDSSGEQIIVKTMKCAMMIENMSRRSKKSPIVSQIDDKLRELDIIDANGSLEYPSQIESIQDRAISTEIEMNEMLVMLAMTKMNVSYIPKNVHFSIKTIDEVLPSHLILPREFESDIFTFSKTRCIEFSISMKRYNCTLTQYIANANFQTRVYIVDELLQKIGIVLRDLQLRCFFNHNDLKPDNVLIDENGNPILCDFATSVVTYGTQTMVPLQLYHGLWSGIMPRSFNDWYDIKKLTDLTQQL